MKKQGYVLLLSLLVFVTCKNNSTPAIADAADDEKINCAKEPNDSADYKYLKYDFYLSKSGQLCERKLAMTRDRDSNSCRFTVYYDSTHSFYIDGSVVVKPLSAVIDVDSYEDLNSTLYSKDKSNVYRFYPNSGGGTRVVVKQADPLTFRVLCEYRWGIDKNYVYYESTKIEGLNIKKVQVIRSPDTAYHFVEYVKDDKHVFCRYVMIEGADPKSFKIVEGQKWDAEDKNHKYNGSGRFGEVKDEVE